MKERWTARTLVASACIVAVCVSTSLPASAHAGNLDPRFGTRGTVSLARGDSVLDLVVQKPLQKYLVLLNDFPNSSFAVVRLNLDGSLDPAFGPVDVAGMSLGRIRLLEGGAFLVVGTVAQVSGPTTNYGIGLARFLSDGMPDTTFGTGGVSRTFFNGPKHGVEDALLQSDGHILVVDAQPFASTPDPNSASANFRLTRFTADGRLDTGFGHAGMVTADFGGDDHANAAVLQPDDKIVVVGTTDALAPGAAQDAAAARFRADGTLDSAFGGGGRVIESLGSPWHVGAVAVQADGHLLLAGANDGGSQAAIVRLDPSGSVDKSFGTQGVVAFDPTPGDQDEFLRVSVTPANQIVLLVLVGTGPFRDGVVRLNGVTGGFDPSFGFAGAIVKPGGPPRSMIVHGNGKVVMGTYVAGPIGPVPAVERFLGS